MTIDQTRKILVKISQLEDDIERLKQAQISLATQEYVSATMSSGGGSKSFSRADYTKITSLIIQLSKEITSYQRMISGQRKGLPTETIFLQGI